MPTNIRYLDTVQDVERALELSRHEIVVLYKHSPICSICETAIEEIQLFAQDAPDNLAIYQVDVLAARPASLKIEELTGVRHESPQVLLIVNGIPVWNASHRGVRASELRSRIDALASA